MQSQFRKNILILLLINVIVKPVYILGIDAQVQNAVGASDYGLYFALFNFCYLFQIVLDLGIQNYNSRTIAADRTVLTYQFGNIFATKLLLIVAFAILVLIGGVFMSYPSSYFIILGLISLFMTMQSMFIYFRSHFPALGKYAWESWFSVLDKFLMILIIGFMLYVSGSIDILKFISGQLLSVILALLITAIFLKRFVSLKPVFSFIKTKNLLKRAWPYALVVLLMTLYTRIDGVMLEALLDDEAISAGIYAAGFRLMDAANMIGFLFAVLLLPMFANLLGARKSVNKLVKSSAAILIMLSTFVTLISWFYAPEILNFIYLDADDRYISVFRYLMFGFWFMSVAYVYGALITASGRLKFLNMIFLAGIAINWTLNWLWIPDQMALGAAKATLITQAFVFLGQFFIAHKMFRIGYSSHYIFNLLLNVGTCFAFIYIMYYWIDIYWLAEIALAGIFIGLVSFLSGFFRLSLIQESQ